MSRHFRRMGPETEWRQARSALTGDYRLLVETPMTPVGTTPFAPNPKVISLAGSTCQ